MNSPHIPPTRSMIEPPPGISLLTPVPAAPAPTTPAADCMYRIAAMTAGLLLLASVV
jgi:hypothetical protein